MVSSQSINQTHTQPKAINKRPLLILGVLLCVIYFLIIIALQDQIKKTVIQNKLDDLNHHLLYQKALRTYLTTQLKPVFLELQKAKKISFDFFEPRAQSSTYIARHVFTIYQQNLKKNGLHGWNFKIAARNPMNPTNQATSQELSLLNQFNEDRTLNKVERLETLAGRKTLYVAIPLKANTAECLRCHGFPSSAPKSLTKRYGTTHGFYEKNGEIRGFISYRIDLKEITQNAQIAFMTISTILALFFITLFSLVSWAYISEKRRKALSMALQQETFYIANHDFLTTLHNRYSLNKDLPKVLENTHINHELWVMMIDIDHFKTVNDTFGHDIGDNALQALGSILKSSCQNIEGAKAYRLGGEEFLLVIANYDPILIERLFHKIQLSLNHADIEGLNKVIHISAGATAYQNNETQYDLLKRADKAMYQAKQQGRARIIIN